jgi:hypothetical protein
VHLEGRKAVLQPFISILAQPRLLNPFYGSTSPAQKSAAEAITQLPHSHCILTQWWPDARLELTELPMPDLDQIKQQEQDRGPVRAVRRGVMRKRAGSGLQQIRCK